MLYSLRSIRKQRDMTQEQLARKVKGLSASDISKAERNEIALTNDNAYHDDPLKAADSRYLHRGDMDWEAAEKRHQ